METIPAPASGERGNPVARKARREQERQGASPGGLGPTDQPGYAEYPMQGRRKNGNLGRSLGTDASPRISRRQRGSR